MAESLMPRGFQPEACLVSPQLAHKEGGGALGLLPLLPAYNSWQRGPASRNTSNESPVSLTG